MYENSNDYGLAALARIAKYNVENEAASMKSVNPLEGFDPVSFPIPDTDDVSVISRSMLVEGNIESTKPVAISGKVSGDIASTEDVSVTGIVIGNVAGKNLGYKGGAVKGNSKALENVILADGTVVIGNIEANYVSVDGKVKGIIDCHGKIDFEEGCLVVGEVSAERINMEEGSILNATITIVNTNARPDVDVENEFNLEV